ncbi:MAG: hypothetical protein AB1782_13465 [Cyanobacteriota bacterium]
MLQKLNIVIGRDYNSFSKRNNKAFNANKPEFKILKKDTISFGSEKITTNDPYKNINSIAGEYFKKLKLSLETGLEFLKTKVKKLEITYLDGNYSYAGIARIIAGDTPGNPGYKIEISADNKKWFESALHEGYHILQFENDNNEDFVRVQKTIAMNENLSPEFKDKYEKLTEIFVNQVFLKTFVKTFNKIRTDIIQSLNSSNIKKIEDFKQGKIFDNKDSLSLTDYNTWFAKLPDSNCLKYLISLTTIEIKAHSYCMSKNDTPLIYNYNDINMDKLRDLTAIKIYSELKLMAQNELDKRENKNKLSKVS